MRLIPPLNSRVTLLKNSCTTESLVSVVELILENEISGWEAEQHRPSQFFFLHRMQNSPLWKEILPHIKIYDTQNKMSVLFFLHFCYKGLEKLHDRIFSLSVPVPSFTCEEFGEGIADFSFPAFFQEQITTSTLSQQCWIAAHGQSQGSPFPSLILLCTETRNKIIQWWLDLLFLVLPVVKKAKNIVEKK